MSSLLIIYLCGDCLSHLLLEPFLVSPVHPKLHLQIKKYTTPTIVVNIDITTAIVEQVASH